jgi:hypothetical protein
MIFVTATRSSRTFIGNCAQSSCLLERARDADRERRSLAADRPVILQGDGAQLLPASQLAAIRCSQCRLVLQLDESQAHALASKMRAQRYSAQACESRLHVAQSVARGLKETR